MVEQGGSSLREFLVVATRISGEAGSHAVMAVTLRERFDSSFAVGLKSPESDADGTRTRNLRIDSPGL